MTTKATPLARTGTGADVCGSRSVAWFLKKTAAETGTLEIVMYFTNKKGRLVGTGNGTDVSGSIRGEFFFIVKKEDAHNVNVKGVIFRPTTLLGHFNGYRYRCRRMRIEERSVFVPENKNTADTSTVHRVIHFHNKS
jgi:hypothetical protein